MMITSLKGIVILISWIMLFIITTKFVIWKKCKNRILLRLSLWYLSFLLMFLFGGISLMEYLIAGAENITNRWILAILSEDNILLYSSLWLISATSFVLGSIWMYSTIKIKSPLSFKLTNWQKYKLNIIFHIAFILTLFACVYNKHFTLPQDIDRTKKMWIEGKISAEKLDLPTKDIFFIYFSLFMLWSMESKKNNYKLIHIIFIISFLAFHVISGGRLYVMEALISYLIFRSWQKGGINLHKFFLLCIVIIAISTTFYNIRGWILGLLKGISIPISSSRIISLLQTDVSNSMYVTIKIYNETWKFPFEQMPWNSSLIYNIISAPPRIINPFHPSFTIAYLFNQALGHGEESGFFMNIVADGILNFGHNLFFVQAFILGFLISLIDRLVYSKSLFKLSFYFSCGFVVIYSVISGLHEFLQILLIRLFFLSMLFITTYVITITKRMNTN